MLAHSLVPNDLVVLLQLCCYMQWYLHNPSQSATWLSCAYHDLLIFTSLSVKSTVCLKRLLSESLLSCTRFFPFQRHPQVLAFKLTVKGDIRHHLEGSFKDY